MSKIYDLKVQDILMTFYIEIYKLINWYILFMIIVVYQHKNTYTT